jgi:hypothetical protein
MVFLNFPLYLFNDFYIYYVAATLWLQGKVPYGITGEFRAIKDTLHLGFNWATGYSYPPLLLALIAPLTYFGTSVSGFLWFVVNILIYIGIACFYLRKHGKYRTGLLLFFITFLPALGTLVVGQVNVLLLVCLVLFFVSKKETVRVLAIGFAAAIKIQLLFLIIPLLFQRKYKSAVLILVVFALLHLPFLLLSWTYYTSILPVLQFAPATYFHLQSYHSFLSRFFTGMANNPVFTALDIGIPAVIFFIVLLRRRWRSDFLIWLLYSTLFAGLNSFANFVLCLPVFVYILVRTRYFSKIQQVLIFISILFTNGLFMISVVAERLLVPTGLGSRIAYALISSTGFLGILLLFIALLLNLAKNADK